MYTCILSISWENYRTNISVLQEAKTTSVEATVFKNQLRWIVHVVRMPDFRLSKQVFYCQLIEGKGSRGGQKKRYKDLLKANLKKCNIKVSTWETQSQGQANLEADHRRRNFYLRSQPLCGLWGKEKEEERERTTPLEPNSQLELPALTAGGSSWPGLDSSAIFVPTEQNTTTILNTEGSPTHIHASCVSLPVYEYVLLMLHWQLLIPNWNSWMSCIDGT